MGVWAAFNVVYFGFNDITSCCFRAPEMIYHYYIDVELLSSLI